MILFAGTSSAVQHMVVSAALSRAGQTLVVQRMDAQRVEWCAAGKCCNAAKVAHALGGWVRVLTLLGGAVGDMLRRDLQDRGVPLEWVPTQSPTRICSTIIDIGDGSATECIEETGPVTQDELSAFEQRLADLLPRTRVLVLSGSLAPGVPTDFYARCIQSARTRGIKTILDVQGAPLRAALPHQPTVVKPNRQELEHTLGMSINTDAQLRQAVRTLLQQGPQWAVITSGAGEVLLSEGTSFWSFAPPRVKPINPIGSGDAFAGALSVGIARGEPVPTAVRLAVAAGASNATQLHPGSVDLAHLPTLMTRIPLPAPTK